MAHFEGHYRFAGLGMGSRITAMPAAAATCGGGPVQEPCWIDVPVTPAVGDDSRILIEDTQQRVGRKRGERASVAVQTREAESDATGCRDR
jgi:hypothetical protein